MKFYIAFIIIFLISFITIIPTFNLGLFGDDWLAFFRFYNYAHEFSLKPHQTYSYIQYFLSSYGAQDILMGVLYKIFHLNSTPYQILSYILRLIAAFSLYPLALFLTKSRVAAFFASLFFSITIIGFDTTIWVFNMPSYISMTFFNFFLYFFLKSRQINSFKTLGISGLFFYLTYVFAPIRMTGLVPFTIIIELFYLLTSFNKKTIGQVGLRLGFILSVFVFISVSGHSNGIAHDWPERLNLGLSSFSTLLSLGLFDFPFYPIISFGDMIFPTSVFFLKYASLLKNNISLFLLVSFLLFLLINSLISERKVVTFLRNFTISICWLFVIWVISANNQYFFFDGKNTLSLAIGGYSFIVAILLLTRIKHDLHFTNSLFIALSWSFLSFFLPWFWVPYSIYPVTYRYLIPSAIGIALFLAILISFLKKSFIKPIYLGIFILVLLIQIIATSMYINEQLNRHSKDITEKIWSTLSNIPEIKGKRLVFYFEGEEGNEGIITDSINFGFGVHMCLLDEMCIRDSRRSPALASSWDELVKSVTEGKTLVNKEFDGEIINPDRVYAYHLKGKDQLINITDITRQKLKEEIIKSK